MSDQPSEKKVSFNETVQIQGAASTFSEKASKYTGIQKAKQLVFIKGYDIDILNVEKDVLELLYQIELLEFSNRNTENSGLPAEIKLETTYSNGLAISKLYCQIEVLNSQKRILEHTLQNHKKQYMELLKA